MYLRAVHADAGIPTLRQIIRQYPLGILTTAIPSESYPLIQCTHIPFLLDVKDDSSETELGVLRGHMARQNPHSKALAEAAQTQNKSNMLEQEVMVLFNVPVHHYVTPKFYTETKPANGKVVPTWNYAAAQIYGKAKIYWDSKAEDTGSFLGKQIRDLSDLAETGIMDHAKPWKVDDAPENYISLLQKNIIGIEIQVERLEGKFKMSQEMPEGDREGVIAGFEGLGTEVGTKLAAIVKERSDLKKEKAQKA